VETLRKKERQDETRFITKFGGKTSLGPTVVPFEVRHKLNYFLICQIFWLLIVSYDENFKKTCSQPSLIPEPV
jgi:hypothetical protein